MTDHKNEEVVYLVIMDTGGIFGAYTLKQMPIAFKHARAIKGLIVRLPVWEDFRDE
jgi:hypothetical protein